MCRCEIFLWDDSGAVTVDWVAVTSGTLLLGIMVVYSIFNGGVSSLVANVNSALVETKIGFGSDADTDPDDGRTGNAADQACVRTGKFVVCMGPK